MDIDSLFLFWTPFLFVYMSLTLLYLLWKINRIYKRWEIEIMMLIPFTIFCMYLWVGLFNPPIELARIVFRGVIGFGLGIGIGICELYLKDFKNIKLMKGEK